VFRKQPAGEPVRPEPSEDVTCLFAGVLWQAQAKASRDEALRLAELHTLCTRFFASVSHELRTPRTAVKASLGLLEAALDERLRPDERRLLANGRRNVARLDGFISDLLALNQIEAGVLSLDPEPLDLRDVVAGATSAVQPLIEQKGQLLAMELPAVLPVNGDQRRLEQVVVNLLGNAHEHTPAGTTIRITGQTVLNTITLSVADDGPGIDAALHSHLFEPFWQLDHASSGSGLGLAIVKGIVDLHKGRIQVVSERGAGTTIRLSFPQGDGVQEAPPLATGATE
jgi:signal transduction histidine kinase